MGRGRGALILSLVGTLHWLGAVVGEPSSGSNYLVSLSNVVPAGWDTTRTTD